MTRVSPPHARFGCSLAAALACAGALPGCVASPVDSEPPAEAVREAAAAVLPGGQQLFVPQQMSQAEQTFVSAVNAGLSSMGQSAAGRADVGGALFQARRRLKGFSGHTGIISFKAGRALRLPPIRSSVLATPGMVPVLQSLWQKYSGSAIDLGLLDPNQLHQWEKDFYDRLVDMLDVELAAIMDPALSSQAATANLTRWLDAVMSGYASAGDNFAPILLLLLEACCSLDGADAYFWAGSGDSNKNGVADGEEDWDGDGVPNMDDAFPLDGTRSCVPPVIIPNAPFPLGPGLLYTSQDPADFTNAYRPAVVSQLGQDFALASSRPPFAVTPTALTPTYSAPIGWVR